VQEEEEEEEEEEEAAVTDRRIIFVVGGWLESTKFSDVKRHLIDRFIEVENTPSRVDSSQGAGRRRKPAEAQVSVASAA
jgi:hypothetical protein